MSSTVNRQIRLARRPVGDVGPEDWEHATEAAAAPAQVSSPAAPATSPWTRRCAAGSTTVPPTCRPSASAR